MQIIILLSVITLRSILPSQLKKCYQDTRQCVVVNVLYMSKVYIHHHYHGVNGIKKKSRIKAKMLKTEVMGKNKISYMKHIKI